jgi:hypothetical protein
MCCTDRGKSIQGPFPISQWGGINPSDCGCGCICDGIGKDQALLRLTYYQEHLKAELKCVERQIATMQGPQK